MKDRRVVVSAVVGLSVLVFSLMLSLRNRAPDFYSPEAIRDAARAQSVLGRQPLTMISVASASELAEALASATVLNEQALVVDPPADVRRALFEFVAEWLIVRSKRDPAAYSEWARSRGWSLAREDPDGGRSAGLHPDRLRDDYLLHSGGKEIPTDASAERLFAFCYRSHFEVGDGALDIVGVTTGPHTFVCFRRMDARGYDPDWPERPALERFDGSDTYSGFATFGDLAHWRGPALLRDVLRAHGEALIASLMVGLKNRRGEIVPTSISAYYDPTARRWCFSQVSYSNFIVRAGVVFER